MFPGYLFAGVAPGDDEGLRHARWTPGVVRLLGVNGEPNPVPQGDIDSLRLLIAGGERLKPVPYVVPGDRVRVKDGPLAGAEGTVVRFGKKNRLVISVSLLQSSVAAELDDCQVEKIGG
jgi:transcription antitermination factor NusG